MPQIGTSAIYNKKLELNYIATCTYYKHNYFELVHKCICSYFVGCKDKREFCKPDAVFTKGKKGAIVEMKNYEGTSLGKTQIDKTYKDMCALKDSMRSTQVSGFSFSGKRILPECPCFMKNNFVYHSSSKNQAPLIIDTLYRMMENSAKVIIHVRICYRREYNVCAAGMLNSCL